MAVKTLASNARAKVAMLVKIRYDVISNPILPGIETVGGIQKLKLLSVYTVKVFVLNL